MRDWGVLISALEAIATELVGDFVRAHGERPLTWHSLHELERGVLSRIEAAPQQDPELLAVIRHDTIAIAMQLPDDDSPVVFDNHYFVPTITAEIWRAYRLIGK